MEESEQQTPQLTSDDSLLQVENYNRETSERDHFSISRSSLSEVNLETVLPRLINKLQVDVSANDLLVSLFISAIKSYKRDSVLRPYPPFAFAQVSNGEGSVDKNFEKLSTLSDWFPKIDDISEENNITCSKWASLNSEALQLLFWILDTKLFTVKSVDRQKFKDIVKLTGQTVTTATPTHIFEVEAHPDVQARFQNERRGRDLIYAYHGSRIENFYSILHNGLRNHMNKNSLFGEGTYLSSELNVCMPYSQTGQGWSKSQIGDSLSCIAVCEIIMDNKVRCHTRQRKSSGSNQEAGEIPEKYYIVQNDELLRVKYLLIYATKSSANLSRTTAHGPRDSERLAISFFKRHRFAILIISYLILLLAIGLNGSGTNSSKLKSLKRYLNN